MGSEMCIRDSFDPIFFDRALRSAHPVEKVDFFNGMRGSDCSIEELFQAHRISHHSTKHTITPYNSSDAGLTATALLLLPLLLLLLLATTRRGTPCSPPASSAYRHPMAAVHVIDDFFATPLLQQLAAAVRSLATLDEEQRYNRDDEAGEGFACAKRTLCSRKRRDEDVYLSTQQAAQRRPPTTREQAMKQFSTDFRLPYFRVSNAPRKSTETNQNLQTRSDGR